MSQSNSDECFLLHQRAYGETSLIIDVFTKRDGKISLIAKGAKKPKSKFLVIWCLFTSLVLIILEGQN